MLNQVEVDSTEADRSMDDTMNQENPLPVWNSSSLLLDTEWLSSNILFTSAPNTRITTCSSVEDISNQGRRGTNGPLNGATLLVSCTTSCDKVDSSIATPSTRIERTCQIVIKQVVPTSPSRMTSQQLGLAREALFYQHLAPLLLARSVVPGQKNLEQNNTSDDNLHTHDDFSDVLLVPEIYYAYGNLETGIKCIAMEALPSPEWLDSGIFFGPGNPNNWSRLPLSTLLTASYPSSTATTATDDNNNIDAMASMIPTSAQVAKTTFQAVARIHAKFWRMEALLDPKLHWLRGQVWLLGSDQASWEASQRYIREIWTGYGRLNSANDGSTNSNDYVKDLVWDPVVRAAVERGVEGISWQKHCDRCSTQGQWTLVHGDFWPGNVLWHAKGGNAKRNELRIVDWEMVGVGSGPQDLGQYLISNMDPQERRLCEHDLVESYYYELIRHGVPIDLNTPNDRNYYSSSNTSNTNTGLSPLWDYCWNEYKVGGVERWLWFLVYFLGQPSLKGWAQFFHDQIAAFMNDHNLSAADITQPRP